ncbi:hypothetical protein [Dactylosporangium sp. NPDC051484]|uniref:hypothetical protein n=1 Tax=Dactylosporangium sp. NPDC051484 TaxID=3154942 RepID=UPI00344C9C8A
MTRYIAGPLLAGFLTAGLLAGCGGGNSGEAAAPPAASAPASDTAAASPSASPLPTASDELATVLAALKQTTSEGFAFTFGNPTYSIAGVYDPRNGGMRLGQVPEEITVIGTDVWARVEPTVSLHYSVLKFAPGQHEIGVALPSALLSFLATMPHCMGPAVGASCTGELDLTKVGPAVPPAAAKLAQVLVAMAPAAVARVPVTVRLDAAGRLASVKVVMDVDAGPDEVELTITGPSSASVAKPAGRIVEAPMDAY